TIVRQAAHPEDQASQECHHHATPPLIAMGQPKKDRRDQNDEPSSQACTGKSSHDKSAIEKFFAKTRCKGKGQVRKQLDGGSGKDALGDGLQWAARPDRDARHAAQDEPLEKTNDHCSDDAGNKQAGSAVKYQAQLWRGVTVDPGAPPDDGDRKPLEGDG